MGDGGLRRVPGEGDRRGTGMVLGRTTNNMNIMFFKTFPRIPSGRAPSKRPSERFLGGYSLLAEPSTFIGFGPAPGSIRDQRAFEHRRPTFQVRGLAGRNKFGGFRFAPCTGVWLGNVPEEF